MITHFDMVFDHDKKMHLEKKDKSSKGSLDEPITELCKSINSSEDYYTTSSCSGRIVILKIPKSGKKNETDWLFVSHDRVDKEQVSKAIMSLPEEEVWFRFEPLILHVAARNIDAAHKLLDLTHTLGIKRSGIIALGDKIVLEIIGSERIDAIIGRGGNLLVSKEYIAVLVDSANDKMHKNWENIRKLEDGIMTLK